MTSFFIRKSRGRFKTERREDTERGGDGEAKAEAENGVKRHKESHSLSDAREARKDSLLQLPEGGQPTPRPGTSGLQNCERRRFRCFKPLVSGNLSQQPQKTNGEGSPVGQDCISVYVYTHTHGSIGLNFMTTLGGCCYCSPLRKLRHSVVQLLSQGHTQLVSGRAGVQTITLHRS